MRATAEEEDADAADVGGYPLGFETTKDDDEDDEDDEDDKAFLILRSEPPPYCNLTRVWAMFRVDSSEVECLVRLPPPVASCALLAGPAF